MMKKLLCVLTALLLFCLSCLTFAEEAAFKTLVKGSKGSDVAAMKLRLFELGYFHTPKLGNNFNDDTVKKVKAFQENNGLPATGEADEATYNAILSETAVSAYPSVEVPAVLPQIDWPERDAEGYLVGEEPFLYEDDEGGFWAYLTQDLQITIIKCADESIPLEWFETDIRLRGDERLMTVENNPARPGTRFKHPFDIATENGYVLGITDDFYGHRMYRKETVGTVIRDGEVLSSKTYNKRLHNLPNLDIMAQYPDGTLKCYYSNEKKADELIAEGVVNVFCFGPALVREGQIDPMVLEGWYETKSPRQALAMYEPNHYLVLSVLGRMDTSEGTGLIRFARMLKARGVEEAFNLDGGNTLALIFNGRMLNKLATWENKQFVRTVTSLIGVGTKTYPAEAEE
ncbi:MAG: phosphodiester glycosidase family protein [Clostridia bacterium]|nr:phosphodiester glycosidase family protein [Clostridia bacterium]